MYNKITIIAATKMEIEPLITHFPFKIISSNLLEFLNNDTNIHILITGMGMLSTAANLAIYATQNERDLFINAGIAGAFDRNISIGTVLFVESETYGDFGVEDGDEFADFFDLGFLDKKEDAFQYGKKEAIGEIKNHPIIKNLKKVNSITVNKVHGNPKTIESLLKKYQPDIENMEGLAFYYVCYLLQKDCIEIRSISNYVEKRNKENWDIKGAIKNLNQTLFDLLESL
ncbi:MAG: futalosine hydrolase [Bacteroidetes bacterium]|jgi:futalosine hydrolase|nr:futalosine hydrolase [Bacteroidota bacterium]MBP7256063.1 futalosine hydrolase [Chitinophagales bacterium]MBK7138423.1 futalosine hydrolase [Bacteroidota bacterium]MBK8671678.1 futalosine hydrolase [Bacteroidota bacterium]MBK9353777.1 futalosine hydrolase [Bacteroidota bacterium]